MKNLLICIVLIAFFGQPNALSVVIPIYPVISLIVSSLLFLFFIINKNNNEETIIFNTNILIPIFAFTLYSFISLSFAPDPQFGLRILFSTIFKFILFVEITSICCKIDLIETLLKTISWMGTIFSIQSILLAIATGLFKVLPAQNLAISGGVGLLDYDYQMVSYGLLGFGKQFVDVFGINFPRFQSMFIEPGYFANFLELSIFATIGYSCIQKSKNKNRINVKIVIQLIALFGSFSTAGWIATFLGYLFYLRCTITQNNRSLKKITLFIFVSISLIICFNIFTSYFPTIADDIYKVIWEEKFETKWGSSSGEQRTDEFNVAQRFFSQKPITGWGSNQVRIINNGSGSNNGFVTIAVELGIFGIFIYAAMMMAIFRTIVSNYKLAMLQSTSIINLNASSTGCVVALITHSFFIDSNWSYLYWIGISFLYSINVFFKVNTNRGIPIN